MSRPLPLQNQFNAGMKRDTPRNRMPPNSAWNMEDYILGYGAPARERGGWAHASESVLDVSPTAAFIKGGIFATFSPASGSDPVNLCFDEDGLMHEIAVNGTVTLIGGTRALAQNPVFHGATAASAATAVYTGLVIIPDATLAAVPKKYDGTTITDLGGAPPKAKFATVYKDYTVLGHGYVGSTLYPNRIWFSQPGDPDCAVSAATAWDTTDSWIDFSLPIEALAATKNALLVFHRDRVSRVRGSSPPPDEDMVVDDPFQKVGIFDPFSITEHQEQVYWCSPEGVFRTDGVSLDDITLKGGMLRYWLDLATSATDSYTFATGIIRDRLLISVMDGATVIDGFMVDLSSYAWTRIKNLDAVSFWDGLRNKSDEEYFARRNEAYVGRCDTMFQVGDEDYKNDGNDTAVTSVLETPFYELGRPGIKTVKSVFVGYELTDYDTDAPEIEVSYIRTPEEETYTAADPLAANTSYRRERVQIGGRAYGLGLKFAKTAAGDFLGYDIAAEAAQQEESKR